MRFVSLTKVDLRERSKHRGGSKYNYFVFELFLLLEEIWQSGFIFSEATDWQPQKKNIKLANAFFLIKIFFVKVHSKMAPQAKKFVYYFLEK